MPKPAAPAWEPDVDRLTASAVDLIWNAYPGYSAEVFHKDELVPSVRQNVLLAVQVLRRGTPPSYDELGDGRSLGSRRATLGVPLESVIQAYRSTERTVILALISGAQEWPARVISEYADLALSTFDLLTEQMIDSYRETSSVIEAAQSRMESELVTAVAGGYPIRPTEMDRWVRMLSISPATPHISFALAVREEIDALVLQRLRRRLSVALRPLVTEPVLFGDLRGLTVALAAPRASTEELADVLASTINAVTPDICVVAGLGTLSPDLAGSTESCREAQEAARVGSRRLRPVPVVQYNDVLVDVLLSGQPREAQQLRESRIGALGPHPHLVKTVRALILANLSQSEAARQQFVHVNTIAHRIKRINEITGLNPLNVNDLVELTLALRVEEALGVGSHLEPRRSENR